MNWLVTTWKRNKRFILFIVLMMFFRSAVADWYHVPSGSMQPNILIGDRVWVDKLAYDVKVPFSEVNLNRHHEPVRGDVIVFNSAVSNNRLIKRVVGVPGDIVEMKNQQVYVNKIAVDLTPIEVPSEFDPFLDDRHLANYYSEDLGRQINSGAGYAIRLSKQGFSYNASFTPIKVPEDHYWVLGDNRDNSADSRVIGLVPRQELVGKANSVIVSFDKENYYLPRAGRFFESL